MSDLLTAKQWQRRKGVRILDPDGWRRDGKSLDERISEEEFDRRLATSTADFSHQVERR